MKILMAIVLVVMTGSAYAGEFSDLAVKAEALKTSIINTEQPLVTGNQNQKSVSLATCNLTVVKAVHRSGQKAELVADLNTDIASAKPWGELSIQTELGEIVMFFQADESGDTGDMRILFSAQNIVTWSVETKDGSRVASSTIDTGKILISAVGSCKKAINNLSGI